LALTEATLGHPAVALKCKPDASQPASITEPRLIVPRHTADPGSGLEPASNRMQGSVVQGGWRMEMHQ